MGKTINVPKKKIEIPEETTLLLDFANLGKTPGRLSAMGFFKRKRKPWASSEAIYSRDDGQFIAEELPDEQRVIKEFFNNFFPKVKEFKPSPYASETLERISSIKRTSKVKKDILQLHKKIRETLFDLTELKGSYTFYYDFPEIKPRLYVGPSGIKFDYLSNPNVGYNEIFLTLFFNFIFNQRELHDLLRLCPTCGRFFFREGKSVYCSEECEKRFNLPTREQDVIRQTKKRAKEKEEQKLKAVELERVKQEEEKKKRLKKSEENKYWKNEARKYREYGEARMYSKEIIETLIDINVEDRVPFEEWKNKQKRI